MKLHPVFHERVEIRPGVLLRPIVGADDPAMARIIRTVMTEFGAVGPGFSIEDPEVDHISVAYAGPGHAYFVVDRGGVVLGGSGVGSLPQAPDDVCELKKMYLGTEGRGQGLGNALMDRCLEAAVHLGYRRCYLETLGTMVAAQRLYERRGFRPIAAPMGATGHHGCNRWFLLDLNTGCDAGVHEVEL